MKKKFVALMVSACTVLALAGCGSKEISNDNIKISQYKGVEVDKVEVAKVTDEEVESSIQSTLEANKISTEVTDRAIQDGDVVTMDYVGKKDGVEFDGGSATDFSLTIGSGQFIDGFETGLVGHTAGEVIDLPLKFPTEYQNAELAGADVVFTITIKSLAVETLPELNDEFVKSVSKKSKTVDEYKKEVKEQLKKTNQETADSTLEEEAWAAVIENTEVKKLPEDQVKKVTEQLKEQYQEMAKYYQMEFTEFLQSYMGMTEDDFTEQSKTAAESSVKQELIINLIAEKEKLAPSEKELKKAYEQMAEDYGFADVDKMKEAAKEEDLEKMVLQDRVKKYLVENCKQVEPKKDDAATTDSKTKETKDTKDTKDSSDSE